MNKIFHCLVDKSIGICFLNKKLCSQYVIIFILCRSRNFVKTKAGAGAETDNFGSAAMHRGTE
jgi:hypothetical protein